MKNFKLTERFTMQFRGEFYNIFNHHNMYIQATNLDIENGTGVTAINTINGSPSAGSANSIAGRAAQHPVRPQAALQTGWGGPRAPPRFIGL
jgi:hypothetical protein